MSNSLIVVIVLLGGFAIASIVVRIISRKWDADVPVTKYTVYINGMVFEHCVFSGGPLSDGKHLITSDGMTLILGGTYAIVEEKWTTRRKEDGDGSAEQ